MEALTLKSKYSEEEILANFEGVDFFEGIMAGLEEVWSSSSVSATM